MRDENRCSAKNHKDIPYLICQRIDYFTMNDMIIYIYTQYKQHMYENVSTYVY